MEKCKNDGNDFFKVGKCNVALNFFSRPWVFFVVDFFFPHDFKVGKCNEAITAYTEALEIDKLNINFNSTVYCNRAAAKMRKKDFQAKKKKIEKSHL